MLVKDSRNLGYLNMLEFPLDHKAYFLCDEGRTRYCSLAELDNKDGCLTCYSVKHQGRVLADPLYKDLWIEFVSAPAYPDFEMQDIPAGSGSIAVLWRCVKESSHEWLSYPFRRTGDKRGCPFCSGKRLAKGESLADRFPEIAREFYCEENLSQKTGLPLSSSELRPSDRRIFSFLCPQGHPPYQMSLKSRTEEGHGCPLCEIWPRSIAALRPDLAAQWHYEKNRQFPEAVAASSHEKVWWLCSVSSDHQWLAAVKNRADDSCPFCSGTATNKTIASQYPELVTRFDEYANMASASET